MNLAQRNWRQQKNLGMALLIVVLLGILGILGWLQYRSTQQVSDARARDLQDELQGSVFDFRRAWESELSTLCLDLRSPADPFTITPKQASIRLNLWHQMAPHPELVDDVILWNGENTGGSAVRMIPTGGSETIPWSKDMAALVQPLQALDPYASLPPDADDVPVGAASSMSGEATPAPQPSPSALTPPHRPAFGRDRKNSDSSFGWMVDQERLTLVHPFVVAGLAKAPHPQWLIVSLNREFLQTHLLPELARRYLARPGQNYDVSIVIDGAYPQVLYTSSPNFGFRAAGDVDARMNLFGPPSIAGRGTLVAGGIIVPPGVDPEDAPHIFIEPTNSSPTEPRLFILAQHRQGSLEAAVAALRRKSLLINFGVLGLLAVTLTLVIVTSQRARILGQMQMDFVAGVSHELKTPLTAISLAARNLEDGVVPANGQIRYGKAIRNQAALLTGLVEEILLFTETHSGRHIYKIEPIDIRLGVQTALESLAPIIDSTGFLIEEDFAADLPLAQGDAAAISQCLQNLITNSIKYGGESKWIGVRAFSHGNNGSQEICASIEDHGIGIGGDEIKQIFQAFYRSPEVIDAQIHGNGLGLPLTKSMVESMGGRLTVASEPGKGSTFTIHLKPAPVRN